MPFAESPRPSSLAALKDAKPTPFWLDDRARPQPTPPWSARHRCDLPWSAPATRGLWTALLAKERDPSLDVVLIEGKEVGWAACGRNGGFCAASLTHGLGNGMER